MDDLQGKYIWIIGASSGIGAQLARELASQGAHVAISARSEDKLKKVKADLHGSKHVAAPLDISDVKSISKAKETILKDFPQIDSTVVMAAIYDADDGKQKSLSKIHKIIDVNVGGAFNVVDVLRPYYTQQKAGQLVLCGSVAGYCGLPSGQPYSATKAAIMNLAQSLRIDLEADNIEVKLISPGFVETPMTDQNDFEMPMIIKPEQAAKAIAKGLCSRRFEIHFPKRFTMIMKLLRLLPYPLYFWLTRKMKKGEKGE